MNGGREVRFGTLNEMVKRTMTSRFRGTTLRNLPEPPVVLGAGCPFGFGGAVLCCRFPRVPGSANSSKRILGYTDGFSADSGRRVRARAAAAQGPSSASQDGFPSLRGLGGRSFLRSGALRVTGSVRFLIFLSSRRVPTGALGPWSTTVGCAAPRAFPA